MNNYQIQRIIEAIEYLKYLTEWENAFINDLADKDNDYELSDKQNHYLNRISQKIGEI